MPGYKYLMILLLMCWYLSRSSFVLFFPLMLSSQVLHYCDIFLLLLFNFLYFIQKEDGLKAVNALNSEDVHLLSHTAMKYISGSLAHISQGFPVMSVIVEMLT